MRRLRLKGETLRVLATLELRAVVGGVMCSDSCHVCDPSVQVACPTQLDTCLCTT